MLKKPDERPAAAIARYREWLLLAGLMVSWLPAIFGRGAIRAVVMLYPQANTAPNPYFMPEYGWLLYIWSPLVVLGAISLLLSPGLLLALALNSAKNIGQWLLSGFALSLAAISVVTALVQLWLGRPLIEGDFVAVVLGCTLLSVVVWRWRLRQSAWPFDQPYAKTTLLLAVLIPLALLVGLAPKFYWESFNGDGAHAYESGRLLLYQPLPFWPASAGEIASFPGITTMLFVFPISWFIRLFGLFEVASRLPLIMYLMPLYGAVVMFAERSRHPSTLTLAERALIWVGLMVYVVVMTFSGTYDPYSADIAMPGTQDTLLMVIYFGGVLAFVDHQRLWLLLFLILTFVVMPNGALLMTFWLVAVVLVWPRRPWRLVLALAVGVLTLYGLTAMAPAVLTRLNLPSPGTEHSADNLLRRLAWVQWADWPRFFYMVVPGGILPAAALLTWKWQDKVARALTLVTLFYFTFFYVQARITLHYFVPVMLLPLPVLWRSPLFLRPRLRPLLLWSVALSGAVALYLSWPVSTRPVTVARTVGMAIDDRIGGYDPLDPANLQRSELLVNLFPNRWDANSPANFYIGSPLVWNYYAHQPKLPTTAINYILQPPTKPAPPGAHLVAQSANGAVYVRRLSTWQQHQQLKIPTPAGSPLYYIPRERMFSPGPWPNGPPTIRVLDVLQSLGINVGRLTQK